MGWNGFAVMTLALGEKTEATICENIGMDDKEMALGTHMTETMWTRSFNSGWLESTGSGRQQGVDGTTWRR